MEPITASSSQRRWIERAQSDSCLDCAPLTPSRLPSPNARKKTFQWRAKKSRSNETTSGGSLTMLFSKLISPDGKKAIMEVSGQVKELLQGLPSRENGIEPLPEDPVQEAFFQGEEGCQKIHVRAFASVDSMPTLPSRILSPEARKDIIRIYGKSLGELLGALPADPPPALETSESLSRKRKGPRRTRSFDAIPSRPSRVLSPRGEKGTFEISGQAKEALLEKTRESSTMESNPGVSKSEIEKILSRSSKKWEMKKVFKDPNAA